MPWNALGATFPISPPNGNNLYARVSRTTNRPSCLQIHVPRPVGWTIALQVTEVFSGASERQLRKSLLEAARHREIEVLL